MRSVRFKELLWVHCAAPCGEGHGSLRIRGVAELTWGLDLSTSARKTAAVALDWSSRHEAKVVEVRHPLELTDIPALIHAHRSDSWAVDVPFGWPEEFVRLMTDRHSEPLAPDAIPAPERWETWRTREIAQRLTDRFVTDDVRIRTRPLPAAFQLLGATAAAWVLIEAELSRLGVVIDRSGQTGSICETYPAAALAAWGFGRNKRNWQELRDAFPFLTVDPSLLPLLESDDVCDAVVCALVVRARDLGKTIRPQAHEAGLARREGWIHVSCEDPESLLAGS